MGVFYTDYARFSFMLSDLNNLLINLASGYENKLLSRIEFEQGEAELERQLLEVCQMLKENILDEETKSLLNSKSEKIEDKINSFGKIIAKIVTLSNMYKDTILKIDSSKVTFIAGMPSLDKGKLNLKPWLGLDSELKKEKNEIFVFVSSNFRSFQIDGIDILQIPKNPAKVIEFLYVSEKNGTKNLNSEDVLDHIGAKSKESVREVFKGQRGSTKDKCLRVFDEILIEKKGQVSLKRKLKIEDSRFIIPRKKSPL